MGSDAKDMDMMSLVATLEMYALLSPHPDNLLDTQRGALVISTELRRRVEGLQELADRMNGRRKKETEETKKIKASKGTDDLEKEGAELELRDQEEGRGASDTG